MVTKEEFDKIALKEKETRLSISRIPKQVKEEFVEFADEEFCSDYGLCFKSVWDNFKLWKIFFQNIDMKLDSILGRLSQIEQNEESSDEKQSIKMLSGEELKGGKK